MGGGEFARPKMLHTHTKKKKKKKKGGERNGQKDVQAKVPPGRFIDRTAKRMFR